MNCTEVLPLQGLYVITPQRANKAGAAGDQAAWLARIEAALAGGARWLQYRDKSPDPGQRLADAGMLRALTQRHGAGLIINDDVALAQAVGADGVHLGQEDGSVPEARTLLGPAAIIGVTCHDRIDLALEAAAAGASYVAFGAFFPSRSKPKATLAPLNLLSQARAELDLPICAIGGVNAGNAAELKAAGADLIAVIDAVFTADDPRLTATQLAAIF
ncbi:thiamine-phosphate diphosphorylase [Ectothiorhodosinus mongolicus]|uniref:Thiamine-phosphate synthase n=1 Tax=Ectothiorhodosinus mongolicus TaxID=233100 RepID=A0A1R3W595_9GAMM|nr:thiamine phosphate synthase [Ectothiorhodosinus mongolicus]ULX57367.1 thiamine phosphate synthase [Ectothiorhodosinus mongolicus]SIT71186.1 thiamine-phosphate diphosphorylase [Ectothiorhodosinus mongolicus]